VTTTAEVWSGKELARTLEQEVAEGVKSLGGDAPPRLVVLLVGDDPASRVYVGQKAKAAERVGIQAETRTYPATLPDEALRRELGELNEDPSVDAILVQLPLPTHLDADEMLPLLDPEKDVDGFHPANLGLLVAGTPRVVPCTPAGVVELLKRRGALRRGRQVVVVGRSRTVGLPVALLLARKGEGGDCTVTICHSRTADLAAECRRAEILIAAVGSARLIKRDWVRPGAVVIDVGISRVDDPDSPKGYRLVGDVDFDAVQEVAGAMTPVPGGVGPLTVAMLLKNTLELASRRARRVRGGRGLARG
jgi:methylenetetrahydrofolate dehydrogenase (NADP+)/methenyltetrahydrofolate cyclohydrolase